MNIQERMIVQLCHKSRIMDNTVVLIRMLQHMLCMATVHVDANERTFLPVREAFVNFSGVRSRRLQGQIVREGARSSLLA
jgi:hypothetical protein